MIEVEIVLFPIRVLPTRNDGLFLFFAQNNEIEARGEWAISSTVEKRGK